MELIARSGEAVHAEDVETVSENPLASVALAVTVNVPASRYVCWIVVEPLIAPRERRSPSPKSIITSRTFAVLPTPTVNVAGTPADTGVVGPARVIPVRGFSPTLTSAVFPATFTVTLAARDVVSVVCAVPEASVVNAMGADGLLAWAASHED